MVRNLSDGLGDERPRQNTLALLGEKNSGAVTGGCSLEFFPRPRFKDLIQLYVKETQVSGIWSPIADHLALKYLSEAITKKVVQTSLCHSISIRIVSAVVKSAKRCN